MRGRARAGEAAGQVRGCGGGARGAGQGGADCL